MSASKRVLALDVRPRSFGFAIFEGPDQLLDWGVKSFRRGVNAVRIPLQRKVASLLDEFLPAAIVVKQARLLRARKTTKAVLREAKTRGIAIRFATAGAVRKVIAAHARNKHELASALAAHYPELASRLPPKRKIWQSEDYRMSIFDAAALGVVFFTRQANTEKRLPEGPLPS